MPCYRNDDRTYTTECDEGGSSSGNCCDAIVRESGLTAYTPNENEAHAFEYTVDRNSIFNPMLNTHDGDHGVIRVKQDSIGGHDVTFNGYTLIMDFDPSTDIDKSPSAINVFRYEVVGNTVTLYEDYNL